MDQTASKDFDFFALPRELRDAIYYHLLTEEVMETFHKMRFKSDMRIGLFRTPHEFQFRLVLENIASANVQRISRRFDAEYKEAEASARALTVFTNAAGGQAPQMSLTTAVYRLVEHQFSSLHLYAGMSCLETWIVAPKLSQWIPAVLETLPGVEHVDLTIGLTDYAGKEAFVGSLQYRDVAELTKMRRLRSLQLRPFPEGVSETVPRDYELLKRPIMRWDRTGWNSLDVLEAAGLPPR